MMMSAEMIRTVKLSIQIPESRELHIALPTDVPAGPAEIVLVVSPAALPQGPILGEFGKSEFFGMWRDRSDVPDDASFAQELRSAGWKRSA